MHYNHFNPRVLENIDITMVMWKGLGMRLQYQRQGTNTKFWQNLLRMQPHGTQKDQATTISNRLTQDQVSFSKNYKYDMNKLVDMKQSTYHWCKLHFSYHPGGFPTFPHDG